MRKLARFGRKGASIGRLASAMHLDRVHVAGDIELPLVVRGWVEVDKRRILTDAGWEIVNAESRGADHD